MIYVVNRIVFLFTHQVAQIVVLRITKYLKQSTYYRDRLDKKENLHIRNNNNYYVQII